jgi:hypothetical protein
MRHGTHIFLISVVILSSVGWIYPDIGRPYCYPDVKMPPQREAPKSAIVDVVIKCGRYPAGET